MAIKDFTVRDLTRQAFIAAVYVVLVFVFKEFSFGWVQFRLAEFLMVLPFYNKKYTYGVTLGCLVANFLGSPYGIADVLIGTSATLIACLLIARVKRVVLVPVITGVVNGVIISALLYYVLALPDVVGVVPVYVTGLSVLVSEIIIVSLGVAVFEIVYKRLLATKIEL